MNDLTKALQVIVAAGIAGAVSLHEFQHPADNPHAHAEAPTPVEGLIGHAALEALVSGESVQSREDFGGNGVYRTFPRSVSGGG
jgi:hypothetical protein